jgi:hypothetical protein
LSALDIRTFEPGDVLKVKVQQAQLGDYPTITEATGKALGEHFAISGWIDDRCIGCCGIAEVWSHRAMAWALLSEECSKHMLEITRHVRYALDLHPCRRIETAVFSDFQAGRRWAELLGFECETPEPMRHFDGNGRSAYLYARIREK